MADGGDGQVLQGPWSGQAHEIVDYEVNIYPDSIEPKPSASHQFLTRLQARADANIQMLVRKNSDYGTPDRPYANFEAAPLVGVSVARGMLVRMMDKLQRMSNLLDRPALNESIQDSCDDLSNYALILGDYLGQIHGKAGI